MKEAIEDHDEKIHKLFDRLKQRNIKLNPEKIQFK